MCIRDSSRPVQKDPWACLRKKPDADPRLHKGSDVYKRQVYGRSQSAFSEDGLPIGAGLEDLGKGLRSQIGTMYGTLKKGPRYLEMAEGYVTGIALDEEDQIIGYKFVNLGKMTDFKMCIRDRLKAGRRLGDWKASGRMAF